MGLAIVAWFAFLVYLFVLIRTRFVLKTMKRIAELAEGGNAALFDSTIAAVYVRVFAALSMLAFLAVAILASAGLIS